MLAASVAESTIAVTRPVPEKALEMLRQRAKVIVGPNEPPIPTAADVVPFVRDADIIYTLPANPLYADAMRSEPAEKEFGAKFVSLDELLARSDFVTLHVPLLPETRHLIDAKRLRQMKKTAILINASRGPVVDERALAEALRDHVI